MIGEGFLVHCMAIMSGESLLWGFVAQDYETQPYKKNGIFYKVLFG